ncbi:MAG: hypothetical protein ABI239_11005 [Aquihabitans sp.]
MALVAFGIHLGMRALTDNSFFTHLATGRLILDSGSVPSQDPYSFTAHGDPWTVQSWGASVLYAAGESVGGLGLVRLLITALIAGLVMLVWRLTAPAESLVARLALSAFVLTIGSVFWNERPLLFGLVGLALVLLASEDGLDPRWLVPVMWLWVNSHGSFPFAVLVLGLLAIGRRLDGESPSVELRAAKWCIVGILLAMVNPIGPRLLLFPATLLEKKETFALIVEWRAPTWTSWDQQLFAVQVLLAVVIVVWRSRSWRAVLPLVVFGALAATSLRNIPPASLVVVPAMATGLAGLGSIDGRERTPVARLGTVAMGALCLILLIGGLLQPHTDLRGYPVEEAAWMRDNDLLDLESRVLTRDTVGNFFEARYGPDVVRVFIDDRVDMYPPALVADYAELVNERSDDIYADISRKYEPTAVLWQSDTPFGEWIESSPRWNVVHEGEDWLVAIPTKSPNDPDGP